MPLTCSVLNCICLARGNGLCGSHYARWKRTGDAKADVPFRQMIKGNTQKDRQRKWHETHSLENRKRLNEIKLECGCVDCGYKEHAEALDFDHLPKFDKRAAVSTLAWSYSWDIIQAEIDKCEVVCANCHRVRTEKRRKEQSI